MLNHTYLSCRGYQYDGDSTRGHAQWLGHYGLMASQFRDIINVKLVDDKLVKDFSNRFFGFRHDYLGYVWGNFVVLNQCGFTDAFTTITSFARFFKGNFYVLVLICLPIEKK
jgi:hypothetical protein